MYSNELYHHGVKGMKWGVRRYERLSNKRKNLYNKAESYDEIILENQRSKDPKIIKARNKWIKKRNKILKKADNTFKKEQKAAAKIKYKDTKKQLNKNDIKLAQALKDYEKKAYKDARSLKKGAKEFYKEGVMDKKSYKNYKTAINVAMENDLYKAQMDIGKAAYNNIKAMRKNKMTYSEAVYGKGSKQYKKGKAALEKATEHWSYNNRIYDITKTSNNKYKIKRTDVYYY